MQAFSLAHAASTAEALALGTRPDAAYLAGGTELLNWFRIGIASSRRVVNIARLPGMEGIALDGDVLRIGALARLNDVARHPLVRTRYPVLSQAILKSASAQIRNLATVGGNPLQQVRCAYFRSDEPTPCNRRAPGSGCAALQGHNERHAIFGWSRDCVAVHPADPPVAMAALDAIVVTQHPDGGRRLPMRSFHVLPSEDVARLSVLRPGELIVAYELGAAAPRSAYLKIRERESYEYATVSAAVALDLADGRIRRARVALGSVAMRPWRLERSERLLVGLAPGDPAVGKALDAGFADARPLSGNAYKVALARNTAQRAIELAGAAA